MSLKRKSVGVICDILLDHRKSVKKLKVFESLNDSTESIESSLLNSSGTSHNKASSEESSSDKEEFQFHTEILEQSSFSNFIKIFIEDKFDQSCFVIIIK